MNISSISKFDDYSVIYTWMRLFTEARKMAAAYFVPTGVTLSAFNNICILVVCGFGKEFYQKTSKTARIYYIALACGQLFAGTFFFISEFTSMQFAKFYCEIFRYQENKLDFF